LRQPFLEPLQQFLHARRRAFLLLDAVLEPLDLILRVAEGFLELDAVAEQVHHAPVALFRLALIEQRDAHETQLLETLHNVRGPAGPRLRPSSGR